MPGRLVMDHQAAIGSQDLKKDRSHAQELEKLENGVRDHATSVGDSKQVNSHSDYDQHGVLPNGVPTSNGDLHVTNGDAMDMSMTVTEAEEVPELDQSWRQHPDNKSLGTLMDRVAQQCYMDLNSTLNQMSELGGDQDVALSNGVPPQSQLDTSNTSLQKKRLLLDFAHDQRDRFTKTLVISDWARNADDMARLIDIKVWQDKQRFSYKYASTAVGETKRRMIDFKVPAPNIEGAMELLATGKASRVPDFGFIPPKRLTARQLLRTIKDMNVTLATRLNLNEEIPYYMRSFYVADGRATFNVPGEFEVDLSVADEDPASPFYFIDIRSLFTPGIGTLSDQLRSHMEARTNEALATRGLQGCYDFLHNFVLTHKINILRNQASELIRGKWFDCVRLENMRRSLVVQYWASMPGPKSWFEIGISSGKQTPSSRRKATPVLSVRWFRKGREVTDEQLDFDWNTLDLEACLLSVIAKHCFGKLAWAKNGVQSLARDSAVLKADLSPPDTPPQDMTLTLSLPTMASPLTVRLEPVTGQYSIAPPSAATDEVESLLNVDPNADSPRMSSSLLCAVAQERIRTQANVLGWKEMPKVAGAQNKFGEDVWQRSVYRLRGWGQHWALAVSFHLSGEKWWVVQLEDQPATSQTQTLVKTLSSARQLVVADDAGRQPRVSHTSLLRIERLAVAEVMYSVLAQQLRNLRIPHRVEELALTKVDASGHLLSSSAVFLRFSALMRDARDKAWKAWAADSVRLSHHGMVKDAVVGVDEKDAAPVCHQLRLSLEPSKLKHLQPLLTQKHDRDIAINATGGLAVRLRTPFGEPFIHHIQKRLQAVERLDRHVAVVQKLGFSCTTVSLARLDFEYSTSPRLSAQVSFANDGSMPVRLKLEPKDSNPNIRIRVMLEQGLNNPGEESFSVFGHLLALTLPLLQILERLEAAHLGRQTLATRTRSATWYNLNYKAPLVDRLFQIRARSKPQGNTIVVRWHIEAVKRKSDAAHEELQAALKSLWQSKDEHWIGIGNGIIADTLGIGVALEKLDEVMGRFQSSDEPAKVKDVAEAAPAQETTAKQGPAQPQPPTKAAIKPEPDVIMLD